MSFRRRNSDVEYLQYNEVLIQPPKYLFFPLFERTSCSQKKISGPRTLFEARKVAGSATYKQSKTVRNWVSVFIQFV